MHAGNAPSNVNCFVHSFLLACLHLRVQDDDVEPQAAAPTDVQEAAAAAGDAGGEAEPEATVMMTRKQRGLYNAMQRGLTKKRQRAESLQAKAKKLKQPSISH